MNKIRKYFDELSADRNVVIETDPILNYEQEMRQNAVFELLEAKENDLILDVGCGNARDLIPLGLRGIHCVGLDLSEGMIREGRKELEKRGVARVKLDVGDATELKFGDDNFDKVICSEVIEHVPNYEKAIREAIRVLKPGGRFVLTTPNWFSLYGVNRVVFEMIIKMLFIKSPHPYDRWKTQGRLVRLLEENGAKVVGRIGVCFIPGHWTYWLPTSWKRGIVRRVAPLEKKIRYKLNRWGYVAGLCAVKTSLGSRG